jgi:hypothetical protein
MSKLSTEKINYVQKRGFEIIYLNSDDLPEEQYPVFMLFDNELRPRYGSAFYLIMGRNKTETICGYDHPSGEFKGSRAEGIDKLVSHIETFAAGLKDCTNEDPSFKTEGKIPIYVFDAAWDGVIEKLTEKYPNSKIDKSKCGQALQ